MLSNKDTQEVLRLIQEDFDSKKRSGLLAAISTGDLNSITEVLDSSIKQELPRIVLDELRNLPLKEMFKETFEPLVRGEITRTILEVTRLMETSGIDYSDAKQGTPTTPQSTPETDITEPSNSVFPLGKVWAELDFLITQLTSTKENLLRYYSDAVDGDSGPVAPDSLDYDKHSNICGNVSGNNICHIISTFKHDFHFDPTLAYSWRYPI